MRRVPFLLLTAVCLMLSAHGIEALEPSDILIYDPLDGATLGTPVDEINLEFVEGVFGQGVCPTSTQAKVLYDIIPPHATIPPPSGSLSFWVKVVADIAFPAGTISVCLGVQAHPVTKAIMTSSCRSRDLIHLTPVAWVLRSTWGPMQQPIRRLILMDLCPGRTVRSITWR